MDTSKTQLHDVSAGKKWDASFFSKKAKRRGGTPSIRQEDRSKRGKHRETGRPPLSKFCCEKNEDFQYLKRPWGNRINILNEALEKEASVPEQPSWIINLSPAITETLFMLGLGNEIIGVSAFGARPEGARKKRRVGSYDTVR